MNQKDEEFTLNWEDLKFLIQYANSGIQSAGEYNPQSAHFLELKVKIKEIEEKFDYKAKIEQERREYEQNRIEEEERKKQEEFKPIKTKVLELSTKFSRLFLKEIAEECKIKNPGLIQRAIEDMIEKKEIKAKYFASSESVVFELK